MDAKTELPDLAQMEWLRDTRRSMQAPAARRGARRRRPIPPTAAQLEALTRELSQNSEQLALHAAELVKRGHRNHGELPGGDQAEDLLQEAALLLTSGNRRWRDDVEPRVLLKMAMLQLASNRWRRPEAREVSLDRIIEGPVEIDREESESDSDTVDLMEGGGTDFAWTGADDEEVSDTGQIPELDGSEVYRLNPGELYERKVREHEILAQVDAVLDGDQVGKEIVRSILGGHLKARAIADDLGVTILVIHQGLRRLQRKLRPFVAEWMSS